MKAVPINPAFQLTPGHCDSLLHTQPSHGPLALVHLQDASTLAKEECSKRQLMTAAFGITESGRNAVNKSQEEKEWHEL